MTAFFAEKIKAIVAALISAALFVGGWVSKGWQSDAQIAQLQSSYSAERTKASEQLALAEQDARTVEQKMQATADKEREKANEENRIISARAQSLVERVRRAEANAATARLMSASTTAACAGQAAGRSDGAELLGQFGNADVLEAERADKIRVALRACYAQYDAARAQVASD